MRIRTYFAFLAVVVTAIPVVLLSMGMLFWNLTRSPEPLPSYEQLPRGAGVLTDENSWEQVRAILGNRPPKSDTFVFDHQFQLIYGSTPLGNLKAAGDTLTIQESVQFFQNDPHARDLLLFQPAGTQLWILLVQSNVAPTPLGVQRALVGFGIGLLVILVISVALAVIMGRVLANSIVRLEKAARRIARGDLESPMTDLRGNDEVKSLGRALETMRQALQEENARQSRFVMGVSHDLKTPLALIKGYVELIKDGPPGSEEAREARFDLILDKVDQLDGMIDHLIDYSKINTDDWQRTWKPLALRPFLEDFCAALAPDARLLNRTLTWQIELPGGLEVPCDARSVRRCLENLVHNALRYTAEGGTVGVQARVGGDRIEITVWDDGPGLSPEDLPRLFDPFYRGTHSRRENGMGLGLSIVKSLLDSHGWTIRAESDRGARFTVSLPVPSQSEGTALP